MENVKIDGVNVPQEADGTYPVTVSETRFVNLTFNTKVDSQQLPLKMIDIDWGDGEEISISGIEMLSHENSEEPHSFYHLYSSDDCSGGGCNIAIKIKDNWGWENRLDGAPDDYPNCWPSCVLNSTFDPTKISFVYTYTAQDPATGDMVYAKFMFVNNMVYQYNNQGPGGTLVNSFDINDVFHANDVVDHTTMLVSNNKTGNTVAPPDWNRIELSGTTEGVANDITDSTSGLHFGIWFVDPPANRWYLIDAYYPRTAGGDPVCRPANPFHCGASQTDDCCFQ